VSVCHGVSVCVCVWLSVSVCVAPIDVQTVHLQLLQFNQTQSIGLFGPTQEISATHGNVNCTQKWSRNDYKPELLFTQLQFCVRKLSSVIIFVYKKTVEYIKKLWRIFEAILAGSKTSI
jgi:hypothetical protein